MPTFTKAAIKATFISLLNKKPLNKITVKEIVEECGINRNSFYYHLTTFRRFLRKFSLKRLTDLLRPKPTTILLFMKV